MRNELWKMNISTAPENEELGDLIDRLFETYKDFLISQAIKVKSEEARHWRTDDPTLVGCCMLVAGQEQGGVGNTEPYIDFSNLAFYKGANCKLEPGMLPYPSRTCAEMSSLERILNNFKSRSNQNLQNGRNNSQETEETEKGDLGKILVVVTVSENPNTKEEDRSHKHVVDSCIQCMTNYDYLLSKGRVSKNTIIYNVRLIDGKPDESKSSKIRLGDALFAFRQNSSEREQRSIRDLLQVREEIVQEFTKLISPIKTNLYLEKNKVLLQTGKNQIGLTKALNDLNRESTEEKLAKLEDFVPNINKMMDAIISAFEEGLSKKQIKDCLGMNEVPSVSGEGFGERELKGMEDSFKSYLLSVS